MYEHFRNDFSSLIITQFSQGDLNKIMTALDKAAYNYDFSEKETSLAILDNSISKLVNLYLASKKLEGLSEKTIECYAGRLRIFFEYVKFNPLFVCVLIL